MSIAGVADRSGKGLQARELSGHGGGAAEPTKAVGDAGRVRLPDGVVAGPDAGDDLVAGELGQGQWILDPGFCPLPGRLKGIYTRGGICVILD